MVLVVPGVVSYSEAHPVFAAVPDVLSYSAPNPVIWISIRLQPLCGVIVHHLLMKCVTRQSFPGNQSIETKLIIKTIYCYYVSKIDNAQQLLFCYTKVTFMDLKSSPKVSAVALSLCKDLQ